MEAGEYIVVVAVVVIQGDTVAAEVLVDPVQVQAAQDHHLPMAVGDRK